MTDTAKEAPDGPDEPPHDGGTTGGDGTDRATMIAMLVCLALGGAGGVWLARHERTTGVVHRRHEVAQEARRLAGARGTPPGGRPQSPFVAPMPRFHPRLRDLPVVRVTGATYPRREPAGSDDVVTDLNLPFAFRLRGQWGCDVSDDMPDATARHCEPYGKNGLPVHRGERLRVVVQRCARGCGASVRRQLSTGWLRQWSHQVPPWKVLPEPTRVLDPTTRFVDKRSGGAYVLVLSHFFTGPNDVRYHVGAAVDGPSDSAAMLQRILNDIRTQCG